MVPELLLILNREYDISATGMKPVGPVWRVSSSKGCFALKRTGSSPEKLALTAEILLKIYESGFGSFIPPEMSKKKLPYFVFNNQCFQLFRWRQGNHPSFTEPDSIEKCARLFAGLHRISMLAVKPETDQNRDLIYNLEQKTTFIEATIIFLRKKPRLNRIDRGLLGWSDYFLAQARYALSGLRNVDRTLSTCALTGFCHNDPASRNIIVENDQWFLIDFELAAQGLLVAEITKLAVRIMQANDWNPSVFDLVIEAYNRERTITDWEKTVLPYLLCFPQSYWRICQQRFEEKLKWSQRRFAAKLWKTTNEERKRLVFLKSILPGL